jgi:glycerophosphoryl diester phosphodiesterase
MPVHVWTVNNPDQMVRLLDLGVDGIMTDRADVLRTILEERGDWAGG